MRKFFLALLVGLGVGYSLFGANFQAKLGMVDDHEIVSFLGPDQRISITEIPKLLMTTEVGDWGQALRFRPSYYTLRIVESMLWHDNPQLWYGARLVLFGLSIAIGYLILAELVGSIPAIIMIAYALTGDYWKDIWTRLGPGEIYAVPALLLFIWGGMNLVSNKVVEKWTIVAITVGSIIVMGSKENFFFLLAPLLYYLIIKWKNLSRGQKGALILSTIFGVFVLSTMYLATSRAGATFYHESLSLVERIKLAILKTPRILYWYRVLPILALAIVVNLIVYWRGSKKERRELIKNKLNLILTTIFMGILVASQVFFYGTNWPGNNRYDFPGVLAIGLVGMLSILWLPRVGRKLGIAVLTVYLLIFSYQKGYYPIREAARQNVIRTNAFQHELSAIRKRIDSSPNIPIVFEANSPLHYEQIASTRRYLLYYGYPKEMYFRYTGGAEEDQLYGALAESMRGISEKGGDSANDSWGFASFRNLKEKRQCIGLVFGNFESACSIRDSY